MLLCQLPPASGRDVKSRGVTDGFESHAVIWELNSSVYPVDLGTLSGGGQSRARAINSIGTVIVGQSETPNVPSQAVRWVNVNGTWTIQDLGTLPGWIHFPEQGLKYLTTGCAG